MNTRIGINDSRKDRKISHADMSDMIISYDCGPAGKIDGRIFLRDGSLVVDCDVVKQKEFKSAVAAMSYMRKGIIEHIRSKGWMVFETQGQIERIKVEN